MRKRKYTSPTSFLMTPEMFEEIIKLTDERNIGISEFIRALIEDFLETENQMCKKELDEKEISKDGEKP